MMEEEKEGGGGGGGDPLCGLCSTPHIRTATLPLFIRDSLFVFHKVFQLSLKDCVTLTTQQRNLMSLCPTCTQLVKDGLSIAKDMDILEGRLANVQTQLREQMKELDLRRVKTKEELMGGGQAQGNGGGVDENEDYEVDDDGSASGIGIIRSIRSASTTSRLNSNAESTVTVMIGPEGKHGESEISVQAYEDPLQIVYEDFNYGREQHVDGKEVGSRVQNDYEDVEEFRDSISYRGSDDDDEEYDWNNEPSSSSRPKRLRVPSKVREHMEFNSDDDGDNQDDDYDFTPIIQKSKTEGRKNGKWTIKNNSCLLCDEKFENTRHLGFHYRSIHPNTKDSGWPCNKCPSTFENRVGLYRHRMSVHENLPIQVYHGRYKKDRKNKNYTYTCLLCETSFTNPKSLGFHYRAKHPNPEWTCPVCTVNFETRVQLYHHRRLKHSSFHGAAEEDATEEFVEMELNGSWYGDETEPLSKSRPERHIRTRTPAKLQEPVESGSSSDDDDEEDELKVKEDDIEYVAPLGIRKSMKTGNRHYSCLLCEEKVINPIELGKHYAAKHPNTMESGWQCNKCPKNFRTKGNLYGHRKIVHKNLPFQKATTTKPVYICLLCDGRFGATKDLGVHYKTEHPDPEWTCPTCSKQFPSRALLYNHRRVDNNCPPKLKEFGTDEDDENEGNEKKNKSCSKPPLPMMPVLLVQQSFTSPSPLSITTKQGYRFLGRKKNFRAHYKANSGWTCPTCSANFPSTLDLYNHRRIEHDNDCSPKLKELITDEDYETDEKNKSYPKSRLPMSPQPSLISPLSSDASEDEVGGMSPSPSSSKEKEMSFACPFCPMKYRCGQDLNLHYKEDHPDKEGISQEEIKKGETSTSGNMRFICLVCDEKFPDQFTLRDHYKNEHANTDTWKCNKCDKDYKRYSDLDAHRREAHKDLSWNQNKKKRCRDEDEDEDEEDYLPKKNQEGTKPCLNINTCLLCDKVFSGGRSLGVHYKTVHPGIKSWECNICGVDFEGKSGLWYHKRSAHKDSEEGSENKESSEGTIDKLPTPSTSPKKKKTRVPNVCLLCEVVRGNTFELNRHYKDVHGPNIIWKCFTCEIIFSSLNSLYGHRRDVHRDLPASLNHQPKKKKIRKTVVKSFPCSICRKVFASYPSLLYHKQHNHENNQGLIVETNSGRKENDGRGVDSSNDEEEEERVEVEWDQNEVLHINQ